MYEEDHEARATLPDKEDVLRAVASALRAARLYLPNNPVYAQSIKRSFEILGRYLADNPEWGLGIDKTSLIREPATIDNDYNLHRNMRRALSTKGIREVTFLPGLAEQELLSFYALIAGDDEDGDQSRINVLISANNFRHITIKTNVRSGVQLDNDGSCSSIPSSTCDLREGHEGSKRMDAAFARDSAILPPVVSNSQKIDELPADSFQKDFFTSKVHALISLLSIIPDIPPSEDPGKKLLRFSGVVQELEEALKELIDCKDYDLIASVLRSFRTSVPPTFKPRLADALRRADEKGFITRLLQGACSSAGEPTVYQAVRSCLCLLDREATPALLEMLAIEEDRPMRRLLVRLLRDLGKNQIAALGERLSDERWYFVRNIVTILGECKKEEAVAFLEKIADHKNFQIRQEVVRALTSLGGERAAELLIRFMKDKDIDIRFMAIRGMGSLAAHRERAEQALIAFLRLGWLKRLNDELRLEALSSLGRIGGTKAVRFLEKYTLRRWWVSRKTGEADSAAARNAIGEIENRLAAQEPIEGEPVRSAVFSRPHFIDK